MFVICVRAGHGTLKRESLNAGKDDSLVQKELQLALISASPATPLRLALSRSLARHELPRIKRPQKKQPHAWHMETIRLH